MTITRTYDESKIELYHYWNNRKHQQQLQTVNLLGSKQPELNFDEMTPLDLKNILHETQKQRKELMKIQNDFTLKDGDMDWNKRPKYL